VAISTSMPTSSPYWTPCWQVRATMLRYVPINGPRRTPKQSATIAKTSAATVSTPRPDVVNTAANRREIRTDRNVAPTAQGLPTGVARPRASWAGAKPDVAGGRLRAVDDTLCRKRGLTVYGTGMHHDPLISSRAKPLVS